MARKTRISAYLNEARKKRVSEVDLMSGKYPLSLLERRLAERIQSLGQIRSQIVVATERTLQRFFNNESALIPIPVRTVDRRLDQCRSRD